MDHDVALMEASLTAVADAGIDIRPDRPAAALPYFAFSQPATSPLMRGRLTLRSFRLASVLS